MSAGKTGVLLAVLLVSLALFGPKKADASLQAALGYDGRVVDTEQSTRGEAYCVQGLLQSLDIGVVNITDYSSNKQWQAALPQVQLVLFPEGDPLAFLQATTIEEIRDWVKSEGGVVIIFNDESGVANGLLGRYINPADDMKRSSKEDSLLASTNVGQSAKHQKKGGGGSRHWEKSQANASSLFLHAPERVEEPSATRSWNVTAGAEAFPSFVCLYGSLDDCVAWMLPDGRGFWFSVGPDYFDTAPLGLQDGGWVSAMTAILNAYQGPGGTASRLGSWLSYAPLLV